MAQLDKTTIDAIKKITDAIEGTGFFLNRFSVSDSGIMKTVIDFDIREIEEDVNSEGEKQ
jgi:hypothetical protein